MLKRFLYIVHKVLLWLSRPVMLIVGYWVLILSTAKLYKLIRAVTYNTNLLFSHAPADLKTIAHGKGTVALISSKFSSARYSATLHTLFQPVSLFNSQVLWVVLGIIVGFWLIRWTAPLQFSKIPVIGTDFIVDVSSFVERFVWTPCRWAGYLLSGYLVSLVIYLLAY